ncbi:MAG: porin [Pseudomonadota bacterium]
MIAMNRLTALGALLAAASVASAPALAEEELFPRIEGEIPIEIQNDYTFDADNKADERNDIYTTIEPAISIRFTENFSFETDLVLEPVLDPDPNDDRFFEDEGLFVQTAYLVYRQDTFEVFAGKINPTFGVAWDIAPGVYGTDLAEDYEITERIGFGGAVTLGGEHAGSHTLTASTFFADTSFLSESIITERPRNRKSSGGVSNTEDFSSFSVTLDGDLAFIGDGIGYHLGVVSQEGGVGNPEDELGVAVALFGEFAVGEDTTVGPVVEYVHQSDAGGADEDRDYITLGFGVTHGPWNFAVSDTIRNIDPAGGGDADDNQIQVSGGYEFENGLTFDVGYKHLEDGGNESNTLGALLTYTIPFSAP